MTEKDRKYINDKLYLLRKELTSAIKGMDDETGADIKNLQRRLSSLETKVARDSIKTETWQDRTERMASEGRSTYLSRALRAEQNRPVKGERTDKYWDEDEEEALAKDLVYWASRCAAVHKRDNIGILFRVAKLLKEVSIEYHGKVK